MKKLTAILLAAAILAGMSTSAFAEGERRLYLADKPLEVEQEVDDEEPEEEEPEVEQPANINTNPGTGR